MTSTEPRVHGIDATYYTTKDLPASTKFYSDLLGMEPTVQVPDFVSGEQFVPTGGVMFAVDDVAAFVADAKARGVVFEANGEVTDTPSCHMAFGKDPEGNGFIIHRRK
jgi:catechol 2,3-dioxygenase-like lactoylglutathione lyase family enzyme